MAFWGSLIALGFKSYAEYLDGKHWQEFKAKYKASGKSCRCIVCNDTPIQLHHHTYDRLGKELLTDVTPLCHKHHKQVHVVLKKNEWFVEKTPQAIAEIGCVTLVVPPPKRIRSILGKEKGSRAKIKTKGQKKPLPLAPLRLKPSKKLTKYMEELAKVHELSPAEMVFLFQELVARGYAHRGVPKHYVPNVGDSSLPGHLLLMIRSWKNGVTRSALDDEDRKAYERDIVLQRRLTAYRQRLVNAKQKREVLTHDKNDPLFQIRLIVAGFRQ